MLNIFAVDEDHVLDDGQVLDDDNDDKVDDKEMILVIISDAICVP